MRVRLPSTALGIGRVVHDSMRFPVSNPALVNSDMLAPTGTAGAVMGFQTPSCWVQSLVPVPCLLSILVNAFAWYAKDLSGSIPTGGSESGLSWAYTPWPHSGSQTDSHGVMAAFRSLKATVQVRILMRVLDAE